MNRSTPWLFLALVCLMSGTSSLVASKVIYLKPLDEGFIEIYLKEGETWFRDDGKGPSAFDGHAFADGDDKIISFGAELDPTLAVEPNHWLIRSANDDAYGAAGQHPLRI